MKLLDATLKEISARRKGARGVHPALMTHVVLGYPSLQESIDIVRTMADAGAKIIELQIPFSDPMADGPTIMAANEAALRAGVKVRDCLKAGEQLARAIDVPLLFMSYYNILYRYASSQRARSKNQKDAAPNGTTQFCRDAASAGIQGLIIPDVPIEAHEEYWDIARKEKLSAIPIVTPISTPSRLKKIEHIANGSFIYCVTATGTTGARKALPKELPAYLRRVKQTFSRPLAVGFGISSRPQVVELSTAAEIAIVGSAVVDVIRKAKPGTAAKQVRTFVRELARE